MNPDTPLPGNHRDFQDGTAAISPVTDAMMDHAAHEAAALADGVATGAVALGSAAERGADEAGEAARDVAAGSVGMSAGVGARALQGAEDASSAVARASREAFDRTADAAERTADAAGQGAAAAADALSRYGTKVIEAMRSNVTATSEHVAALMQARSIPEAVTLNAEHLRRRIEALTTQGRELASLAQQAAFDVFGPMRDAIDRSRRDGER